MKKRFLAIIMVMVMMLLPTACNNKKDEPSAAPTTSQPTPVTTATTAAPTQTTVSPTTTPTTTAPQASLGGKYVLTVYEINGEDMLGFFAMMGGEEFDPNSMYIEFQSDGKCKISLDDNGSGTYTLVGNKVTIEMNGEEMEGTFDAAANQVILEKEESGNKLKMAFDKQEGADTGADTGASTQIASPQETLTAVQEKWNGIWYGYMWIMNYFGIFEGEDDELYDAFMSVDIDKNGKGKMTIYIGESDEYLSFDTLGERLLVDATITADEYHVEVTEGRFLDEGSYPLNPANWFMGSSPLTDEPAITIADVFRDSDNDGYDYMFAFRSYGSQWADQMGNESHKKLPPGFDGYISEVKSGGSGGSVGSTAGSSVSNASASANKVGSFTINTEKIHFAEPITVEDDFGKAFFTVVGDDYYVLSDDTLRQYKMVGGSLVFEKNLPLNDDYNYIFSDDNGILYVSDMGSDLVAFRDGKQLYTYDGLDRVTVHPTGDWGISWFVSSNVQVVWLDEDVDEIDYDDETYPEVGMISSVNINQKHIIIAGTTPSYDTNAIFVYDEDDDTLLLTMGDKKSGEPGYMSNVTAVAETKNGYMALDANMNKILFWDSKGAHIGTVEAKQLFGTIYPWLCTAVAMPDGSILVGMTDAPIGSDSGKEFMLYRLTGF